MPFQERTWEEVTREGQFGSCRCPIEGEVEDPRPDWRAEILDRLENQERWPNVEFLVFVQCIDMGSSHFGAYNMVLAGPGYAWTAETIARMHAEPLSFWYGDTPSQRMYPRWYLSRARHLKEKLRHAQSDPQD